MAYDTGGRVQLRVSLYPWVPDAEAMVRWIKADFEARHPHIGLVVRPPARSEEDENNPEYVADLAYDVDSTVAALTGDGPDAQDLVEIDAVMLGALARRGAVAPFPAVGGDFLPFAVEAVTWNRRRYGVPHWACGYFVVSAERRAVVAGELDGSGDAALVYLDSFRDTCPGRDVQSVLAARRLESAVNAFFASSERTRWGDGQSLCAGEGVNRFARGGAAALVGYSERLNSILRAEGRVVDELTIASAVLGNGDHPALFTDALVMSPRCTSGARLEAACQFAEYYTSDRVFETLMMSRDVGPSTPPRYLLPSTSTAFDYGAVATDRLYQQLRREIAAAALFPRERVFGAQPRGEMRAQVREALEASSC